MIDADYECGKLLGCKSSRRRKRRFTNKASYVFNTCSYYRSLLHVSPEVDLINVTYSHRNKEGRNVYLRTISDPFFHLSQIR